MSQHDGGQTSPSATQLFGGTSAEAAGVSPAEAYLASHPLVDPTVPREPEVEASIARQYAQGFPAEVVAYHAGKIIEAIVTDPDLAHVLTDVNAPTLRALQSIFAAHVGQANYDGFAKALSQEPRIVEANVNPEVVIELVLEPEDEIIDLGDDPEPEPEPEAEPEPVTPPPAVVLEFVATYQEVLGADSRSQQSLYGKLSYQAKDVLNAYVKAHEREQQVDDELNQQALLAAACVYTALAESHFGFSLDLLDQSKVDIEKVTELFRQERAAEMVDEGRKTPEQAAEAMKSFGLSTMSKMFNRGGWEKTVANQIKALQAQLQA